MLASARTEVWDLKAVEGRNAALFLSRGCLMLHHPRLAFALHHFADEAGFVFSRAP
jgi:hypothetical protein